MSLKVTIGYTTGEFFEAEALRMELLGRYEGIAEIQIALDGYGKEREALANAIERLETLRIPVDARVYVDDENRCPSYARHWWVVSDERDRRGYKTNVIELDDEEHIPVMYRDGANYKQLTSVIASGSRAATGGCHSLRRRPHACERRWTRFWG